MTERAVSARSRYSRRQQTSISAIALCFAGSLPAMADGEFFQADYAPGASSFVGSLVRGPTGASIGWSQFDDGSAVSANVTYGLPVPALWEGTLRFGPSARLDQDGKLNLGARISFERWTPTDWGSVFVLADYNTILNEYLLLGEMSRHSGLSASLAIQGGDDGFRENTFVLGYAIPETSFGLRLGYRFNSREVIIGFAINTF